MRIGQSLQALLLLALASNTVLFAQPIQTAQDQTNATRVNGTGWIKNPYGTQASRAEATPQPNRLQTQMAGDQSVLLQPIERSILQTAPTPIQAAVPTPIHARVPTPIKSAEPTFARQRTDAPKPHYVSGPNRAAINQPGPLDRFVVPKDRVQEEYRNPMRSEMETLIPIKPERAPVTVGPASRSMLTGVNYDAPRPEYEALQVEPYHHTPHGQLQPVVQSQNSAAQAVVDSKPMTVHQHRSAQVQQHTQQCCDEWGNLCQPKRLSWDCQPKKLDWECQPKRMDWECQPKRLDWECDCEQFPRPERTVRGGSCGTGCRVAAIKERVRGRINQAKQRLACGCINECAGQCQQHQSPECNDSNQNAVRQPAVQGDDKERHGPGPIGFGTLKKSQGVSSLNSQDNWR